jgi:MoaA/NifB/PqqE/SkfB family radical SAM enzyme
MTNQLKPRIVKNYIKARYFYKPAPMWLDFRTTNRCNHRCDYCNIPNEKANEMTTDEVKTIIDKTKHVANWVLVTGGECLLRDDIGEIVDYIKKTTDMTVVVNTNMFLLKEKFEQVKNTDAFFFSLDGLEATHDKHRLKGSYKKVIEALEFLQGKKYTLLSLAVLHKDTTIGDLEHILQLSEKYSFNSSFQLIRHYQLSKDSKKIDSHNQHGVELMNYLIEQKKKGRPMSNTTKNLEMERDIAMGINKIKCYSGRMFCYITSEGKIALCFSRPNDDRYLNLKDKGVTFEMALKRLEEIRPGKKRCAGCTCTTPIEMATFSFLDPKTMIELYRSFKNF